MNKDPIVAVVGATGLVGREIIAVLEEKNFPFSEIKLLASERSAGDIIEVGGEEVTVETLTEDSFDGVDIALFSAGGEISKKFVPIAAEAGTVCIDNSSYFRMHDGVPLVVPEVNFNVIKADDKIIANPNCSTIQLVMVLKHIHDLAGLKRVVVSTYQSVSGAGKKALDELWNQSLAIFNQKEIELNAFKHQIAFNCIPHIDIFLENGYTKEEMKVVNESRKILGISDLKITATTVRVPVFHSHAESVNVETKNKASVKDIKEALKNKPGVELFEVDDEYPIQIGAAGGDSVQVGRIRLDESVDNGVNLWIVSDNLRKGAALNAVQIAQRVLETRGS